MARSRGRASILRGALLGGALLATALVATRARAQAGLGGFDDASLPGRWEARLRIASVFDGVTEQFGGISGLDGSRRVGLGARFSFDSLNAARLPVVARTQRLLADSLGVGLGLTLGNVATQSRTLVTRVPMQLDLGLTRRVAIGVTIPIVQSRSTVIFDVNRDTSRVANLGFNPAVASLSSTTESAQAIAQNRAVLGQLGAGITQLAARIGSCQTAPTPKPAECAPILANPAGANQLVQQARTVARGLVRVYGDSTRGGALLVPIQGTDAQRAVNARLNALAAQFTAFQIPNFTTAQLPAAATAMIGAGGLQRVLTDEQFGIVADSARGVYRSGLGDVELGGNVMWLDTFGASGRRPGPGLHVRSTAGASYRLGTGTMPLAFELFDVATGSGAALLLRSATDIAYGRRFWGSVVARVESPSTRSEALRIPVFPGELLATADRERLVDVKPGRVVTLEVTPRWTPNDYFAIAAHYAMRSASETKFTGTFTSTDTVAGTPPATIDASVLGAGTGGRAQMFGFGLTYSTLGAYARRRAWLPIEVSYLHTATIAGSGGAVPLVRNDQLVLRVYAQIIGRSQRRAPSTRPATAPSATRR